jgi:hypothetical protein
VLTEIQDLLCQSYFPLSYRDPDERTDQEEAKADLKVSDTCDGEQFFMSHDSNINAINAINGINATRSRSATINGTRS